MKFNIECEVPQPFPRHRPEQNADQNSRDLPVLFPYPRIYPGKSHETAQYCADADFVVESSTSMFEIVKEPIICLLLTQHIEGTCAISKVGHGSSA